MQLFTPHQYALIDVASSFGLDKLDWDERIQWTLDHHDRLESLTSQAEEPALFFASTQALRAGEKGQATGYGISLDAAASGLQILSCLTGCETSAKLCGVVSTGHRADAYTTLYGAMNDRRNGRGRQIARSQLKDAMISGIYGSKAVPERVFNYDTETLGIFYTTMEEDAPGAWALRNALLSLWVPYTEHYGFVMPDNFHVHKWIEDKETVPFVLNDRMFELTRNVRRAAKDDRSICANAVHATDGYLVREMGRRCTYDPALVARIWELLVQKAHGTSYARKKDQRVQTLWTHYQATGMLSARILEDLDERNFGLVDAARIQQLLETFAPKPFAISYNHDCFRAHPNHGNALRRMYNQLLSELAASHLAASIMSQIKRELVQVIKAGDIAEQILEADYALA